MWYLLTNCHVFLILHFPIIKYSVYPLTHKGFMGIKSTMKSRYPTAAQKWGLGKRQNWKPAPRTSCGWGWGYQNTSSYKGQVKLVAPRRNKDFKLSICNSSRTEYTVKVLERKLEVRNTSLHSGPTYLWCFVWLTEVSMHSVKGLMI